MPTIEIKNLSYSYKGEKGMNVLALDNLNALFCNGKISAILGSSGSGKTTLLRLLAGLDFNYKGNILFSTEEMKGVPPKDRNLSYVSQNFSMYPHMTLFDSIAYPLKLAGAEKEEIKQRVYDVSRQLDIFALLSRKPNQVSLGELQRACIARAIVKRPEIALFDEPLANLDEVNRNHARHLLKNVLRTFDSTVIYVTHSLKEATSLADTIYVIEEGKIKYSCTPKEASKLLNSELKPYFESEKYD